MPEIDPAAQRHEDATRAVGHLTPGEANGVRWPAADNAASTPLPAGIESAAVAAAALPMSLANESAVLIQATAARAGRRPIGL